jgi:hypothetical protein
MENRYTGVFEQIGDWWTGYVEECETVEPTARRICKDLGIRGPGEPVP